MNIPPAGERGSSEYAEHVSAILEEVGRQETESVRQKPSPVLTRTPVVVSVALVFGVVVAWNVVSMRRPVTPLLPPSAQEAALRVSAMAMSAVVESYRDEHGELPESIEDLGFPPEMARDFAFVRKGKEYELVVSMDEMSIVYHSAEARLSLVGPADPHGPHR